MPEWARGKKSSRGRHHHYHFVCFYGTGGSKELYPVVAFSRPGKQTDLIHLMGQSKTKAIFQYIIMILLTAGLLWLSLRGLNIGGGKKRQVFCDKSDEVEKRAILLHDGLWPF